MQNTLHIPMDQTEVIRFLESGAGTGMPALRINTHGAMVFLIGEKAYKIKRAVTYDYMDLSTVQKRHALLDREYALNQPIAPSIYEAVLPVVRHADGSLAFGGRDAAIEWVLVMKRFEASSELINIARQSGINDDLAQALGASIARYHKAAPVRHADASTLMLEILDELDRVFASLQGDASREGRAVIGHARADWMRGRETLHQRSVLGRVRRCHGDLHMRNIVLIDGVPTPFDALEFDERLGTCDTLYDLAFLIMDLDHAGMRHAANLVLNAYLTEAGGGLGGAGLSVLPLYLSVRAAIRGMVDIQTAAVAEKGGELLKDADVYLRQARGYLRPTKPILMAIGGYSGTGKTTLARTLAHHIGAAPGAIVIRSDVLRKVLRNLDPLQRLPPEGYAPQVSAQTYATMRQQAAEVLRQGHCALLDAVHGDPSERQAAEDLAAEEGAAFLGIWLSSGVQSRLSRVLTRGPDASDADADVVHRQAAADPGPIGWHKIDTDQPVASCVQSILALLQTHSEAGMIASGGEHAG